MKAAQLRQAILQAAVQGKLVPQDPRDEPASMLLERIQTQKNRLIKEGKIKKEKPLPPITEEDIPYGLPVGWEWCRLKDIAELINGRAYKKHELLEKGKYPVLRVGNLFTSTKWYYSNLELEESKYCSDGDLLYAWSASFGSFIWHGEKSIFHYHIWRVDLFVDELKPFILWLLEANTVLFKSGGHGISMVHVTKENTERKVIPIPPLQEQQRIVARIEKLMAFCDELEAAEKKLDSLEANLAEYLPKSILQAAVRGALVPQSIHDEPASELLKRIQEEKSRLIEAGKLKKEKPLPPISEEEKPYDLPNGWEWCRLGEVCLINPRNQLPDDREVSFIPMALISNSYFGGHHQEIRVWGKVKSGFTHFAENDIVLAKITPCFQNGKSCIVKNLKNGFGAGTTELHVLRCLQISPKYLLNFLKNPEFLRDGEKNMTGTAGQQRVPTNYIKNILFPLPPLAEQQRIVAKVDELMTLCEQLKNINPDSSLPLTDIQKTLPPLEISTPPEPKEQQYAIAARGDISTTETKEHRQAIEDLFGDGADG